MEPVIENEELMFFGQLMQGCSAVQLLRQVLMHSHNAIVVTDSGEHGGYRIVYANQAFCRQTGYELSELVGLTPAILQGPNSNYDVIRRITPALKAEGYFQGASINYRKDGTPYPVEWNISAIKNQDGQVSHYMSIQSDLTRLKSLSDHVMETTEQFKQLFFELVPFKRIKECEAHQQVLQTIKDNEKLQMPELFDEDGDNLPDSVFFEFDAEGEDAAPNQSEKDPMTPDELMREASMDEEDVQSILEAVKAVDLELAMLENAAFDAQKMAKVSAYFQDVSNALFYCVHFEDGALIIDDVAKKVAAMDDKSNLTVPLLASFNAEVQDWIDDAFVTRETNNVFEGEQHVVGAGKQLLASL